MHTLCASRWTSICMNTIWVWGDRRLPNKSRKLLLPLLVPITETWYSKSTVDWNIINSLQPLCSPYSITAYLTLSKHTELLRNKKQRSMKRRKESLGITPFLSFEPSYQNFSKMRTIPLVFGAGGEAWNVCLLWHTSSQKYRCLLHECICIHTHDFKWSSTRYHSLTFTHTDLCFCLLRSDKELPNLLTSYKSIFFSVVFKG